MKHFKFLTLMLAMIASISFLVSCGDDDDTSSGSSIVGTWEINEMTDTYYYLETLIFTNNGEWIEHWNEIGNTGSAGGTYTVSGNKLYKYYDWDDENHKSGDRRVYTYSMPNNNVLVLIEPDGDTETYTRVK